MKLGQTPAQGGGQQKERKRRKERFVILKLAGFDAPHQTLIAILKITSQT
jgi:hypothetical protein